MDAAEELKLARRFGAVAVFMFMALAAFARFRGHPHSPYIFGSLSAFFIFVRFLVPSFMLPVFKAWMLVANGISWANTHILLTLAFFIVFTPLGLLMRLLGKDPMQRKFKNSAASYWQLRSDEPDDPKRYEQRF
ncbi:MAG: SxtJ family membrane protein [bacterium]